MPRLSRIAALLALGVFAGLVVAPSAGASPGFAAAPTAVIRTILLDRADLSAAAWNRTTDSYSDSYVHPTSHRLVLNSCNSTVDGITGGRHNMPGVVWNLRPVNGQHPVPLELRVDNVSCVQPVNLPALGAWDITLTVRDSAGATSTTVTRTTFRDMLVVALGDSHASGEGNPPFFDVQCHRSQRAWPEQAARKLETSNRTVTLLNFACSGASVHHLTTATYGGQEPSSTDRRLRPQLLAARAALGDPLVSTTRTVDVLFAAVGANDMGASSILKGCALPHINCRVDLGAKFTALGKAYEDLELAASANLRIAKSYLPGYPSRVFTNTADKHHTCGAFSAMTDGEASWFSQQGATMLSILRTAAATNEWSVTPTTDLFRGHGYCATPTWFRALSTSELTQGNVDGSAHPNRFGQAHTATAMAAAVRTDALLPPRAVFTVKILSVRVDDQGRDPNHNGSVAKAWNGRLNLNMEWLRSSCGHSTEILTGLRTNRTIDVSANTCARFPVNTVGRAVRWHTSTRLGEIDYSDAQFGGGQRPPKLNRSYSTTVTLRRATAFGVTGGPQPVVRTVRTTHDFGTVTITYIVTTTPVIAPTSSR